MPEDRKTKAGSARRRALIRLGALAGSLLGGLGALILPKRASAQRAPTRYRRTPSTGAVGVQRVMPNAPTIGELRASPVIMAQYWKPKAGQEAQLETDLKQAFEQYSKQAGIQRAAIYKLVVGTEGAPMYTAIMVVKDPSISRSMSQTRGVRSSLSALDNRAVETQQFQFSEALMGRIDA